MPLLDDAPGEDAVGGLEASLSALALEYRDVEQESNAQYNHGHRLMSKYQMRLSAEEADRTTEEREAIALAEQCFETAIRLSNERHGRAMCMYAMLIQLTDQKAKFPLAVERLKKMTDEKTGLPADSADWMKAIITCVQIQMVGGPAALPEAAATAESGIAQARKNGDISSLTNLLFKYGSIVWNLSPPRHDDALAAFRELKQLQPSANPPIDAILRQKEAIAAKQAAAEADAARKLANEEAAREASRRANMTQEQQRQADAEASDAYRASHQARMEAERAMREAALAESIAKQNAEIAQARAARDAARAEEERLKQEAKDKEAAERKAREEEAAKKREEEAAAIKAKVAAENAAVQDKLAGAQQSAAEIQAEIAALSASYQADVQAIMADVAVAPADKGAKVQAAAMAFSAKQQALTAKLMAAYQSM